MEWFDIFAEWITYPVIAVSISNHLDQCYFSLDCFRKVLLGTGVGQIRYLNRALMRFDSKVHNLLYYL